MEIIKITDINKDYEAARSGIEKFLKRSQSADTIISETLLIFEAICHNINEQINDAREREKSGKWGEASSENANMPIITVTGKRRMGYSALRLEYEGPMFRTAPRDENDLSPEERIIKAYDDRIDCSYRTGYNKINITARRSTLGVFLPCLIAVALAIIVYIPIHYFVSADGRVYLWGHIVFPLEELFTNAMLLAGAPVTFLSLIRNLTNTYVISERASNARKLHIVTIFSSVISVLLAIGLSFVIFKSVGGSSVPFSGTNDMTIDLRLPVFISTLLPDNIFTPFMTISPFPIIVLAIIITYALCSSGKYFNKTKGFMDAGYALFSKILNIIMHTLPFFIFVAFLDMLLLDGFADLLYLLELVAVVVLGSVILFCYYFIRLLVYGVPIKPFFKKLFPLLLENLKINSAIDAVPYTIRYCARNYGMDRKNLESSIPMLAQVNLDGNCFFITLIAMILMLVSDTEITIWNVLAIAVMVFFLSFGAPNQVGSILIALVIILNYMSAHNLIPIAIFSEVFFGALLNITNVCGDMITVAEQEMGRKKKGTAT